MFGKSRKTTPSERDFESFFTKSDPRVADYDIWMFLDGVGASAFSPLFSIGYPWRFALRSDPAPCDDGYDITAGRSVSPRAGVFAIHCQRLEGGDFAPPSNGLAYAGCTLRGQWASERTRFIVRIPELSDGG